MPQPRIMLVVTGDDFGYCPKRNQGIVDCFKAGGISSVSLLVNASAAKDAADLAKRHNIPIGLHANLSEGIPVCQSLRQASTLVNEHGFFHGKMGFRQALERHQLSMKQVELELRDQIRLFRELTGHLPHHMDGHQHVHILQDAEKLVHAFVSFRLDYYNAFLIRIPVKTTRKLQYIQDPDEVAQRSVRCLHRSCQITKFHTPVFQWSQVYTTASGCHHISKDSTHRWRKTLSSPFLSSGIME
ncbi:carbohydrate deacetylase isoform X4 [Phyllopteryx taeniolatus]|uniref:carbohydrate deacetylase isoform X4 n=1 Tax=Phyllopteryx taeniolatus TaxID=161469 RepID=UPI002AD52052|nr:carbohydrate deacetylase isoform X4 [Phyllopteryx taeniolatus]